MNHSYILWGHRLLLAFIVLLAGAGARAQAPAWQALFIGTPTYSPRAEVNATATDVAGNVYLAGEFSGTIQLGTTTLVSTGTGDNAFVAKWSPASQSFVWALRLGGSDNDYAQAIAVSGGSVYVGLNFRSPSLVVGSTSIANTSTPGSGTSDGLLVKLTDAGSSATVGWAQQVGGAGTEAINALAAVGSSVYVAGSFASAPAQLGGTTLTSAGSSDVFVARFTDAGATSSLAWAQRAGSGGADQASAVAVSGGSVYVTGTFEQTTTFGFTTLVKLPSRSPDVFVAKLADVGAAPGFTWAVQAASGGNTYARGLAANGNSVYVVGEFNGPAAVFGSTVLPNANGTVSSIDAFVAKLTDAGATGAFTWAQLVGGIDYDQADAVAVRGSSVYMVGHSNSPTLTIGPATLTNTANTGSYDLFVARLRDTGPTGTFVWAQGAGSPGNDYARTVALGGSTVYVAGSARPSASFGSQVLSASGSGPVAFLATLADATGLASAAATVLPGLRLFPNPAHNRATVQVPAIPGAATATLTVLDALGRVLRTQTAPINAPVALDLTGLAPGLYAVRVAAGGSSATRKLVVE